MINTLEHVLLPVKVEKNRFDCFHTLFIYNMVSNFSQVDKTAKIWHSNRHEKPKNINVQISVARVSDYYAMMVLTKFQVKPCNRRLKNWNERLFWWPNICDFPIEKAENA